MNKKKFLTKYLSEMTIILNEAKIKVHNEIHLAHKTKKRSPFAVQNKFWWDDSFEQVLLYSFNS